MQVFFEKPLTKPTACAILCENFSRKDTAMKLFTMMNHLYTVEKRDVETMYGTLSGLCRHTHFSGTVTATIGG